MIEQQITQNPNINFRFGSPPTTLTNRERDILTLAARGLGNQDIATRLGISGCTVKAILHRVCVKLGAQNRFEAVFNAMTKGYIGIHEIVSLDELADIFASMGPAVIDTVAQRLKVKQLDQLVEVLAPLGSDVIGTVAQRLKVRQEQRQLPPISAKKLSDSSSLTDLPVIR